MFFSFFSLLAVFLCFFLQLNGAFHPLEKNSNIRNIPQNLNHWFMAEILPYWGCLGYLEYFFKVLLKFA